MTDEMATIKDAEVGRTLVNLDGTGVTEITELGAAMADADEILDDDGQVIAAVYRLPENYETHVIDLDALRAPHRAGPAHKAGNYQVVDVASFLAYYDKHAGPAPEVWVGDGSVTAVLDAHMNNETQWEKHRLTLTLRHSPEWNQWISKSGQLQGQQGFAEFIEDAAANVVTPDAATMLEVAQSLQAATKVDFKSAYRTRDGQRAFRYEETTTARAGQKGELEIPERITLALRVYLGQDPVPVNARFRYRITDDGLRLAVVLDQVPEILEAARDAVVDQITDGTDRGIVLRGSTVAVR